MNNNYTQQDLLRLIDLRLLQHLQKFIKATGSSKGRYAYGDRGLYSFMAYLGHKVIEK